MSSRTAFSIIVDKYIIYGRTPCCFESPWKSNCPDYQAMCRFKKIEGPRTECALTEILKLYWYSYSRVTVHFCGQIKLSDLDLKI